MEGHGNRRVGQVNVDHCRKKTVEKDRYKKSFMTHKLLAILKLTFGSVCPFFSTSITMDSSPAVIIIDFLIGD